MTTQNNSEMPSFFNRTIVRFTLHALAVILPLTLLIFTLSTAWRWEATYEYEGHFFKADSLGGFPFPMAGQFPGLNACGVRSMTINWTNYYLNMCSALLFATTLHFFLLRKLRINNETKIIFGIIATITCIYCVFCLYFLHNIMWDYQGGKWPTNLEICNFK